MNRGSGRDFPAPAVKEASPPTGTDDVDVPDAAESRIPSKKSTMGFNEGVKDALNTHIDIEQVLF